MKLTIEQTLYIILIILLSILLPGKRSYAEDTVTLPAHVYEQIKEYLCHQSVSGQIDRGIIEDTDAAYERAVEQCEASIDQRIIK